MQPEANTEEQVIRGIVERVTYRNDSNGYSVIKVIASDSPDTITVVGALGEASVGKHVIIRGSYKDHIKFGRQFAAVSITETRPSTRDGLVKYLGSGLVKGIGPKSAERMVEKFGESTVDVILQSPEKIAKITGVGKHKAQLLHQLLKDEESTRESRRFLLENNISPGLSNRILKKYGQATVEALKRDPYDLARNMRGVGFATADSIAMNIGLRPDSAQRIKAGLYHSLERASDDGHCYLGLKQLFDQATVLLGLENPVDLSEQLESLAREHYVVLDGETAALRRLYEAERYVAEFVAARCEAWNSPPLTSGDVERSLENASAALGLTFSAEQRDAVLAASQFPLLVVTGGPGCGKTTIIRAISSLFRESGKRLSLAAPTGRAAQRMSQVCGMPASTIHRLLKYDPSSQGFLYNDRMQLEMDAIIIDECSMMDITLAKDLFSAIPKTATVILVGDRDQLPSVGPGRVFGDLVSLHEVKTIALSRLFRRSDESHITGVAHMINSGIVPSIPEPDGETKADAYFLPRPEPEEAAVLIEKLVSDQLPRKFGFEPDEICVLTPTNRGPLGTIALNQRLQAKINPSGKIDVEQEITVGETTFRIGDRVCQRVNNYQIDPAGVYNGDLGRIYAVDKARRALVVDMWDGRLIRYEETEMHQLNLAYAITVHRSQGSEIPCVVLALHDSHYSLLERQLIYTGVTRAKKLLIIVGSKRALHIASKRATTAKRLSRLAPLIRAKVAGT